MSIQTLMQFESLKKGGSSDSFEPKKGWWKSDFPTISMATDITTPSHQSVAGKPVIAMDNINIYTNDPISQSPLDIQLLTHIASSSKVKSVKAIVATLQKRKYEIAREVEWTNVILHSLVMNTGSLSLVIEFENAKVTFHDYTDGKKGAKEVFTYDKKKGIFKK